MRTAVVLPAPLGPSTPSTVARSTARSTPRSASTVPNRFTNPTASTARSVSFCCSTIAMTRCVSTRCAYPRGGTREPTRYRRRRAPEIIGKRN